MSTPESPSSATPAPKKRRNPWIWVSGGLALAAVGLLIWGVSTQADLNSSEDDVSDLQTQVSTESTESEAAKDLADDLAEDLGVTNEDLAAIYAALRSQKAVVNRVTRFPDAQSPR